MKIVDASIEDGKHCSQLLAFLKVAKLPDDWKVGDAVAIAETMGWLNELVKQLAGSLAAKKPSVAIIPDKKTKGKN